MGPVKDYLMWTLLGMLAGVLLAFGALAIHMVITMLNMRWQRSRWHPHG